MGTHRKRLAEWTAKLTAEQLTELDNQILDGQKSLWDIYRACVEPLGISDRAFYRYASRIHERIGAYDRFSPESVRRQLGDLLPHDRPIAARRFGYLQEFMREDRKRGGKGRSRTRREVAERLSRQNPDEPITPEQLERFEKALYCNGVSGLVTAGPRVPFPSEWDLQQMARMPLGELLTGVSGLLKAIAGRIRIEEKAAQARARKPVCRASTGRTKSKIG